MRTKTEYKQIISTSGWWASYKQNDGSSCFMVLIGWAIVEVKKSGGRSAPLEYSAVQGITADSDGAESAEQCDNFDGYFTTEEKEAIEKKERESDT